MNKTVDEKETSDAVRQLRHLRFFGGRITRSTEEMVTLANGIPYCFAEAIYDSGSQLESRRTGRKQQNYLKKLIQ